MSDEYINRYIVIVCCSPHLGSTRQTREHHILGLQDKHKIKHSIGQYSLLVFPHFEIDFVQPPRFLNSEHSQIAKLDIIVSPPLY